MSGLGLTLNGLNLAARLSGASTALKRVPTWVWKALAVVALAVTAFLVHQHYAHKAIAAAKLDQRQADDAAWKKALDKAHADALAWKSKADQLHAQIAQDERNRHEEDIRRNAADARSLLVRGPGAASASHCGQGDHPGLPAGTSRHDQAASGSSNAAAPLPADDRAIVPWSWLVQVLQEHDDLLSEDRAWRDNDAKQRAAWPNGSR